MIEMRVYITPHVVNTSETCHRMCGNEFQADIYRLARATCTYRMFGAGLFGLYYPLIKKALYWIAPPSPPSCMTDSFSRRAKIVCRLRITKNWSNPSLFQYQTTLGKPDPLSQFFLPIRSNRDAKLEHQIIPNNIDNRDVYTRVLWITIWLNAMKLCVAA